MTRSRMFRFIWLVTGVTILCLTAFRLWLPNFIEQRLTERFERIDSHTVTFSDVEVSLLQGSYCIKKIQVLEGGSKAPLPLFTAEALQFELPFSNLTKGNFFCVLEIDKPAVNFIRGPSEETSQLYVHQELIRLLRALSPYPIDEFHVRNGAISFRDYHQTPRIEIELVNIALNGTNLQNSQELEKLLPGKILGQGKAGEGDITIDMNVNPLQNKPIFEMTTSIDGVNLGYLSSLLRSDYNIQIEKGVLSAKIETESKDNVMTTRIEPNLQNVKATRTKNKQVVKQKDKNMSDDPRVLFASWNQQKPADGAQIVRAEVQNYKGNLLSLTGEALIGIFKHAVITEIEKSTPRPAYRPERKIEVSKAPKEDDKKGFLKKLFKKREDKKADGDQSSDEEGTLSASER